MTKAGDAPVVLVLGGHSVDSLTRTLSSLGGCRIWCAVASQDELVAAAGIAQTVHITPWPKDTTTVLQRLASVAADEVTGATAIVLVRAGTRFRRDGVARALRRIRRGATAVVPAFSRRQAFKGWIRLRTHRRSRLIASSGVVLTPAALDELLDAGALAAGALRRVGEVKRWVGAPRISVTTMKPPSRRRRRGLPARSAAREVRGVTVVIPAHNEEEWIGATLAAIHAQTRTPDEIIVVDDGSTDRTGEIARAMGARVIRPEKRRGFKAAAVNVALGEVRTDAVMIVDADTELEPHAIDFLLGDLAKGYDATGGAVRPRDESSMWARGRALQYALAARFFKPMQRDMRATIVVSGCISCYRTEALRSIGGLPERTVGEDLDATWSLYLAGGTIGFQPRALALTSEPPTFDFYRKQIRRWSAGMFQSLRVHRTRLRRRPGLLFYMLATLWDLVTAPFALLALPVLVLAGTLDVRWLGIPALINAITLFAGFREIGVRRTLRAFPAFMAMVWLDMYFYIEGMLKELFLGRNRLAWERGR